jgi:hypothetical protein
MTIESVPCFDLGTYLCCSGRRGFATGDFEKQLMPEAAVARETQAQLWGIQPADFWIHEKMVKIFGVCVE